MLTPFPLTSLSLTLFNGRPGHNLAWNNPVRVPWGGHGRIELPLPEIPQVEPRCRSPYSTYLTDEKVRSYRKFTSVKFLKGKKMEKKEKNLIFNELITRIWLSCNNYFVFHSLIFRFFEIIICCWRFLIRSCSEFDVVEKFTYTFNAY